MQSMFFDHNEIKFEINNKRKCGKIYKSQATYA